jgi:hypothetical protein
MLTVLSMFVFAQTIALPNVELQQPVAPISRQVRQSQQEIRPLPGELDDTLVFNSNSPELVQRDGILLSTFPATDMAVPTAHLDHPLEGRFDIFAHHVARGLSPDDTRTLYLGILVHNPNDTAVTLDVLQGVTYLSQEAPFNALPSYVANPLGTVYSGPGSRTTNDILRDLSQPHWPSQVRIPAGKTYLLVNVPIPLRRLTVPVNGTLAQGSLILPSIARAETTDTASASSSNSPSSTSVAAVPDRPLLPDNRPLPSNGRSLLMRVQTSGPVYVASLAMYAPETESGAERVPTQAEWEALLQTGDLAGPRDHPPTPPDSRFFTRFYYGRVAGVAEGSVWTAQLTDSPEAQELTIPPPGERISYVISTVDRNTFSTGQIQSAPMRVRYPDTAYRAHGNYGVLYDLTLPLHNPTEETQTVHIMLQTPFQNEFLEDALLFSDPPEPQIFFRGTVRLRYTDEFRVPQTRYFHVVHQRGQAGEPLVKIRIPPGQQRLVEVDLVYPPDATPPQVLTIETAESRRLSWETAD